MSEVKTWPGSDVKIIAGAEVGPGGGELMFENEKVRIWDMRLEPGEKSTLHTHLLDTILIQIDGDRICVDPHTDSEGEYKEYLEQDIAPGDLVYVEKGGTETAVNVGAKSWREILIEMKI